MPRNLEGEDEGTVGRKSPNYTDKELALLTSLVEERKRDVEDKRTDFNAQERKKKAWEEIALKFNSSADVKMRTKLQLMKKWDNMKFRAKKSVRIKPFTTNLTLPLIHFVLF